MFDDESKPMTDQMLDYMRKQGYEKKAIDYAEHKLKVEKDLNFAMKLAKTLSVLEISKQVFDVLEE